MLRHTNKRIFDIGYQLTINIGGKTWPGFVFGIGISVVQHQLDVLADNQLLLQLQACNFRLGNVVDLGDDTAVTCGDGFTSLDVVLPTPVNRDIGTHGMPQDFPIGFKAKLDIIESFRRVLVNCARHIGRSGGAINSPGLEAAPVGEVGEGVGIDLVIQAECPALGIFFEFQGAGKAANTAAINTGNKRKSILGGLAFGPAEAAGNTQTVK